MSNQPSFDVSSPRKVLFERARILVVDDQLPNVRLLERHLMKAGCADIKTTTDSRLALPMYREFAPDVVLLDLMMLRCTPLVYQSMGKILLLLMIVLRPHVGR